MKIIGINYLSESSVALIENGKLKYAISEERLNRIKNWWGNPFKAIEFVLKETNNKLATRARFKDSVDFIGWYINKTSKILKISKKDVYRQYLAYYKGWGDYKNYKKDKKAIIYAKSVKDLANKYRKQLTICQKNLDKNKYFIF